MKKLKIILSVTSYVLLGLLVLSALGSAITNKPVFLTAISSDSMAPVFERGDMVVIWPLSEEDTVSENDIVIFSTDSGHLAAQGWIIHRIVSGDPSEGFVTQGDNNDYTDQDRRDAPLIERDQIVSRAPTLGDSPIVLPFIGYIALWFEDLQESPFLLPGIITLLSVILGVQIIKGTPKRRKKRKSPLGEQLLFSLSGLTLLVALMVTMLMSGSVINYNYEVIEEDSIGDYQEGNSRSNFILHGDHETTEVSDIRNDSFLPLFATVTADDPNFTLSHRSFFLNQGEEKEIAVDIQGKEVRDYESTVFIGLYYPILPADIIYRMASYNYYLSVIVVAAIPSMPLILYPIFNKRLRHRTFRFFRKKYSRLRRLLPSI